MSRGDLQEMEQSKTAVNANAAGDPCYTSQLVVHQLLMKILVVLPQKTISLTTIQLKIREPKVKTVKDVVNKGLANPEPMKGMKEEEEVSKTRFWKRKRFQPKRKLPREEEYDIEEDVNGSPWW